MTCTHQYISLNSWFVGDILQNYRLTSVVLSIAPDNPSVILL